MDLILLLVAILLVGVAVAVAVGRVRGGLDPAPVNRADNRLPDGPVRPADLQDLAFTVELRGYRMEEVDAVLDRLAAELAARDATLSELRRSRATAHETGASLPESPVGVDAPGSADAAQESAPMADSAPADGSFARPDLRK